MSTYRRFSLSLLVCGTGKSSFPQANARDSREGRSLTLAPYSPGNDL